VRPQATRSVSGNAGLDSQHRMAGGEDKAEDVIINHLVKSLIHCFTESLLLKFKLSRNLSMLFVPASGHDVERRWRAALPLSSARPQAFPECLLPATAQRPQRERPERVPLQHDIAGDAGNPCDESRGLDLPHGLDRFMCVAHA